VLQARFDMNHLSSLGSIFLAFFAPLLCQQPRFWWQDEASMQLFSAILCELPSSCWQQRIVH